MTSASSKCLYTEKKYCAYSNTKLTIRRDVVRKISKVTREKRLGILPK